MTGLNKIAMDNLARAAYKAIRKEYDKMKQIKREITKEQAQKVIHEDDWSNIFDVSEVCGYGVYDEEISQEGDKYYVTYMRGDSCD